MHSKILDLGSYCQFTGDATSRYIDPRDTRLSKYASHAADALAFMASAPAPPEGHVRVLVLAMTSWEFYGPNRNGDGFHARPFVLNGKILSTYDETLPVHHVSFEKYGKNFMHHVNKDPNRAVGYVERSFWNERLHRVELVVLVDRMKAPTIVQRIMDGEFPAVSMGCKIPYDICVKCGNYAPTQDDYCIHVNGLDPRYGLGVIEESGLQHCVLNPKPMLFDISWVVRPADRHGYMMQLGAGQSKTAATHAYQVQRMGSEIFVPGYALIKEASAPTEHDRIITNVVKAAALRKLGELEKYISGDLAVLAPVSDDDDCGCWDAHEANRQNASVLGIAPLLPRVSSTLKSFSDDTVSQLSGFSLPDILMTALGQDIVPTTQEIFRIECARDGLSPDTSMMNQLPSLESALVEAMSSTPEDLDQYQVELGLELGHPDPDAFEKISQILAPYREKRALNNEHIARRLLPEPVANVAMPAMGMDPYSRHRQPREEVIEVIGDDGSVHRTTRRAAEDTDWMNKRRKMTENAAVATGTGATLASLGMLAASHKSLRLPAAMGMLPVAAIGGGAIYSNSGSAPEVMSTTGEGIPTNTPFTSKQAAYMGRTQPYQLVALVLAEKMASGCRERLPAAYVRMTWKRAGLSGQPGSTLLQKTARAIERWAAHLPQ